jgi:hypothetical protein
MPLLGQLLFFCLALPLLKPVCLSESFGSLWAQDDKTATREAFRGNFDARQVLIAFKLAYPERISRVAILDGEWAMLLDDTWFFWEGGRLLPEEDREERDRYTRYPFYQYSAETYPPPPVMSPEDRARLTASLRERDATPRTRHPGLYNALYRIDDKASSWEQVKTTYFLGMKTQVHRDILEDLAAVEEELQQLMKSDNALRRFVESLWGVEAYNWRNIAGTSSLSFHSYGTAIDLMPSSYGGKHVYWLWSRDTVEDWFSVPWERRYRPPESFIEAFERQGFIWGGKWFYFDTIHFEYRPEIMILNGVEPES